MGALIDSSVLIAAERGVIDLSDHLSDVTGEIALSAVTVSELLHGVHRAREETTRARRAAYVESLLTGFPVVDFDLVAARLHAHLSARLAGSGQTMGAHDLIIAATALARGMDVLTRDERGFARVPELSVIRW